MSISIKSPYEIAKMRVAGSVPPESIAPDTPIPEAPPATVGAGFDFVRPAEADIPTVGEAVDAFDEPAAVA